MTKWFNFLKEDEPLYLEYIKNGAVSLGSKTGMYLNAYRDIFRDSPDMSCRECAKKVFTKLHKWRIENE